MKLEFEVFDAANSKSHLCPIIFLHAILDSKRTWKVVAPQIANGTGRKAYCVDARNHGATQWTDEFTLQLMADDIKEFLKEHKIPKAVLVGSSMGGSVAIRLALKAPELVEKMIVEDMSTTPYGTYGWQIVIIAIETLRKALDEISEDASFLAAKKEITTYVSKQIPQMHPNQNHEFGWEVMPLKEEDNTFKWEANFDVIEEAITSKDFDTSLAGIYGGGVLFLYGSKSIMEVAEDRRIPKMFPRSSRVSIEGAANMTHFELPGDFVREAVRFINGES